MDTRGQNLGAHVVRRLGHQRVHAAHRRLRILVVKSIATRPPTASFSVGDSSVAFVKAARAPLKSPFANPTAPSSGVRGRRLRDCLPPETSRFPRLHPPAAWRAGCARASAVPWGPAARHGRFAGHLQGGVGLPPREAQLRHLQLRRCGARVEFEHFVEWTPVPGPARFCHRWIVPHQKMRVNRTRVGGNGCLGLFQRLGRLLLRHQKAGLRQQGRHVLRIPRQHIVDRLCCPRRRPFGCSRSPPDRVAAADLAVVCGQLSSTFVPSSTRFIAT